MVASDVSGQLGAGELGGIDCEGVSGPTGSVVGMICGGNVP